MYEENKPLSMTERWKNDLIIPEVIGYREHSDNEIIENEKSSLQFMVKHGYMSQEKANKKLKKLYEELGVLVSK